MSDNSSKPQKRRKFTKEFKRDAAALVIDTDRPIAEVARELGIYDSSLGNWVAQERIDRGDAEGPTTDQLARLRESKLRSLSYEWNGICSNDQWPFGYRRQRHGEPLPLWGCPKGRELLRHAGL